ncbi:hypothetical protein [Micromonospora tulbaghiae]|uniref:hypothetical protein n=1 Tax=Micromonospora TaxID=1873 RepID=UPI0013BC9A96|nr:hypothetical protein [Micromonospora aurantiaca]
MLELETALRGGEWLRPGDVALLLNASNSTVIRMLTANPPEIRFRRKSGAARHRDCATPTLFAES